MDIGPPSTGAFKFLTKHTASWQANVGHKYLIESLNRLDAARKNEMISRDDRKQLVVRWDELEINYNSLLPKLRFPQSFRPAVVRESHEFARKARSLLEDTTHRIHTYTQTKAKNAELGSTIPATKQSSSTSPVTYDRGIPRPSIASLMSLMSLSVGGSTFGDDISLEGISVIQIEKHQLRAAPAARGGFGDVWLCDWTVNGNTQKVGVKVIQHTNGVTPEENTKIAKRLFRELQIWKHLNHPNVLKFYGICDTYGMFPGIVSPWMSNGRVGEYLSGRSPNVTTLDRLSLLSQAASGLQYLHENDPPMVHADLKAANVLVDEQGNACLADFGLSRLLEEIAHDPVSTMSAFAGSVRWMAPELFDFDVTPRPSRCLETDIYAFGGLMLELLGGHVPFHTYRYDTQVLMAISNGTFPPRPNCTEQKSCGLICSPICDAHWEYMKECWSIDPKMRPKIADVRAQLERFKNV